jgi:RNA polymerase sigma-70 factor (ECF subfamily)
LDEHLHERTPGTDPEDWAVQEEAREAVRTAMAALPESHRQVIALKFVAGLSNAEVAGILGRSEGAIKAVQHAALLSLRRRLVRRAGIQFQPPPPRRCLPPRT